ncbi:DUF2510 domain-containing protein [Mycobacterium sp. 29Ha]|uniref:DUF2510 domain-containing protein n=1 Tax=Mycobacterium sp. 29Ha TaxID=2939268 RepID=UPI002939494B|nr:DUF2510 domain-containing protein [Mycobacterium sp. 29Ha]MDV3135326.1 DUF2510 domain-containing protein [Mycobacterium sp. 29Ha]
MPEPPIGWYPDPAQPEGQRYWNGEEWTGFAPGRQLADPHASLTKIVVGMLVLTVIVIAVIVLV